MSQPIALIFDLDGTLVDTAPDLLASLNAVLVKAGHRPVAPSELRHLVGHGVRTLFERAFEGTETAVSHAQVDDYTQMFLDHYRANIANESVPFPNVRETLEHMAAQGAAALGEEFVDTVGHVGHPLRRARVEPRQEPVASADARRPSFGRGGDATNADAPAIQDRFTLAR